MSAGKAYHPSIPSSFGFMLTIFFFCFYPHLSFHPSSSPFIFSSLVSPIIPLSIPASFLLLFRPFSSLLLINAYCTPPLSSSSPLSSPLSSFYLLLRFSCISLSPSHNPVSWYPSLLDTFKPPQTFTVTWSFLVSFLSHISSVIHCLSVHLRALSRFITSCLLSLSLHPSVWRGAIHVNVTKYQRQGGGIRQQGEDTLIPENITLRQDGQHRGLGHTHTRAHKPRNTHTAGCVQTH